MSYLCYLCLLAYSGVQHILCYVFVSFFSSCYVPYVVRVSGLSILVFSNVYLIKNIIRSIIIIVIVLYQLL